MTNQKTTTFESLLYQQIHFDQIKLKMAAYNVNNFHVSPDVLSTLPLLQQGNLYKLQQQNYAWHKAALKITQNSQENTCVGVSLQAFRSATLSKRDSNISVFLWFCKIFKSTYFEEHLWTICRWKVYLNINQRVLSQIFLQIFLLYVFKTLKQLFSRLHSYYWVTAFSFLTIFFTISGNVLYYESHFACQFILKAFSVIKVGFHNSKVKTRSFLVIIIGVKPLFSSFAL